MKPLLLQLDKETPYKQIDKVIQQEYLTFNYHKVSHHKVNKELRKIHLLMFR